MLNRFRDGSGGKEIPDPRKPTRKPVPETQPPATILRTLADWYCDSVMPGRGDRPETADSNRVILHRWADWLAARGVTTAEQLAAHPVLIDDFLAWRRETCRGETIPRDLRKLKAMLRAAQSKKLVPRLDIEWPRVPTPRRDYPEPLGAQEYRAILERLRTHEYDRLYYRDIVEFLMFTGARPSDACALTIDRVLDLDGAEPRAFIRQAKTGDLVAVALSTPAVEAIRRAIEQRTSGYVFRRRDGDPHDPKTVSLRVRDICGFGPKRFRQTVVSLLFDSGHDAKSVAAVTGHRSREIETYRLLRRSAAHDAAHAVAESLKMSE